MTPDRTELLGFLTAHYDLEELRTLCFKLYVPDDDLPGRTREGKARELLAFCERHGRTEALLRQLAADHPTAYRELFGRKPRPASPTPHSPRAGQVFISHAHEDSALAHELARWLQGEGYAVWIAPKSIRPGEQWVQAIERGLATSEAFVLLQTPAAVASDWVRYETNIAISQERRHRLEFVPLAVADCEPPLTWQAYQAIPFASGDEASLQLLADRLAERTAEPANGRHAPGAANAGAASTLDDWQADQIQGLAWSVGLELGREDGRNLYQPVYALLNSHFEVSSYKEIPARRYAEARQFLAGWLQQLVQGSAPAGGRAAD